MAKKHQPWDPHQPPTSRLTEGLPWSPGLKAYQDFEEETQQAAAFVTLMSKAGCTLGKSISIDLL